MTTRNKTWLLAAVCSAAVLVAATFAYQVTKPQAFRLEKDVSVPFELVNNTVFVKVRVGTASKPAWFVLDTGDKYAIVDTAVAKAAGVQLGGETPMHGMGSAPGNFVKDTNFSVVGLDGFSQPLFMTMPLGDLAKAFGHEFSGIIGYNFLSQFVVEVDYDKRMLTFHDKQTYQYHGDGAVLPVSINSYGHPLVPAKISADGGPAKDVTFVLDLGSSGTLILHTPFVSEEKLPSPGRPNIPWLGARLAGGDTAAGSVGRVSEISLGRFKLDNVVTVFSRVPDGPLASSGAQGTVGGEVLRRFRVIIDYERDRIILEPSSDLKQAFEYDKSGLHLLTEGDDYRTLVVAKIADQSPAAEAGIRTGDVLVGIDGKPASDYSLSDLRILFRQTAEHELMFKRNGEHVRVQLKARKLV